MNLVSIDPGLNGGLTCITPTNITSIRMPTKLIITKPAVTVFAKDANGNKVLIKSGPNKGTYKRIIRTPAKSHKELDIHAIANFFALADHIVTESPAMSFGNSAKSTASTNRNYGKLLAITELLGIPLTSVVPHKWKKDLNLGRDKSEAIRFAEQLLSDSTLTANQSTFTNAEDGLAESICIAYHYNKELLCLRK